MVFPMNFLPGAATAVHRMKFIRRAMAGVQRCIESGINLRSYLRWSLLDNFEWQAGFAKTFGLIAVDRSTQNRHFKEGLTVLGKYAR